MKKILYLTPYFPYPFDTASRIAIFERLKVMEKFGYRIDLHSVTKNSNVDKSAIKSKFDFLSNLKVIPRKSDVLSFGVASLQSILFKRGSIFLNLITDEYRENIDKALKNEKYDAIICEHTYMAYWFQKNFPYYSKKLICIVHNIEANWYKHMFYNSSEIIKKLYYYLEYISFQKIEDRVFKSDIGGFWFLSNFELDLCDKSYHLLPKSMIIPGLPLNLSSDKGYYEYERCRPVILYVSRLDSVRNVNALKYFAEEVFPKIIADATDAEFMIVGKGASDELKGYLAKSPVAENINFVGEVEELSDYYRQAKIVIVPALENIGIQTKLFEAIREKSVVVCTSHAVNGTFFESGEGVLIAENSLDFARKCIGVLRGEINTKEIFNQIMNIEKKFNDAAIINKMDEFILRFDN